MKVYLTGLLVIAALTCHAQNRGAKPAIDTGLLGKWPSIQGGKVSNNGKYVMYNIDQRPVNSRVLIIKDVGGNWQQSYTNATSATFSDDGRWVEFKLRDSSWRLMLGGDKLTYLPQVQQLAQHVAAVSVDTALVYKSLAKDSFIVNNNLMLDQNRDMFYSNDRKRLFFYLNKKSQPVSFATRSVNVHVWNYKDAVLQSRQQWEQLNEQPKPSYAAFLDVVTKKVIRLEREGEQYTTGEPETLAARTKFILLKTTTKGESWWHHNEIDSVFLVSLLNGSRRSFSEELNQGHAMRFELSPNEEYLIYYNPHKKAWFSYATTTGIRKNLTRNISTSWEYQPAYFRSFHPVKKVYSPVGILGWIDSDNTLLIYDANSDIWSVDPKGLRPSRCLTKGYAKANRIRFNLVNRESGEKVAGYCKSLKNGEKVIMQGFNDSTKEAGLFKVSLGNKFSIKKMIWGKYSNRSGTSIVGKAGNSDSWLLTVSSPNEARNLFVWRNDSLIRVSNLRPQQNYRWYTSEVLNWKLPDGENCQGILFKPEDMDVAKKYPVLFNYYAIKSDGVFDYRLPEWTGDCNANVPYWVSRGYLVFMPDIHYKIGHTGQSALNSVESAARYLSQRVYVDKNRLGLMGFSFGGFETNYIVTHSHMFRAAASGAGGGADPLSDYLAIDIYGNPIAEWVENGQLRMGANPWKRPDLYRENSAVLNADKVTTPFLIQQNKLDNSATTWAEGIKLFIALRRLQKQSWMLEYDGEGHGLQKPENVKDYTIRLTQFFDHYLKGAPPPKWMTEGIAAKDEGIKTGYELDTSGLRP